MAKMCREKGEEVGWPAKGAKRKKGRVKTGQINWLLKLDIDTLLATATSVLKTNLLLIDLLLIEQPLPRPPQFNFQDSGGQP